MVALFPVGLSRRRVLVKQKTWECVHVQVPVRGLTLTGEHQISQQTCQQTHTPRDSSTHWCAAKAWQQLIGRVVCVKPPEHLVRDTHTHTHLQTRTHTRMHTQTERLKIACMQSRSSTTTQFSQTPELANDSKCQFKELTTYYCSNAPWPGSYAKRRQ